MRSRRSPPARSPLAAPFELAHRGASQVTEAVLALARDTAHALTNAMLHARPELLPTLDHARSNLTNGGLTHVAEVVLLLARELVHARPDLLADLLPPNDHAGPNGPSSHLDPGSEGAPSLLDTA